MNENSGTAGKSGYYMRLTLLLGILVLLGGTLYYDKMVKFPANKERLEKFCAYLEKNFDGLEKAKVRSEAGMAPVSTTAVGKFEVDHFRYNRALPFLPSGQNIYVAYDGDYYYTHGEASSVTEEALVKSANRAAKKNEPDPNQPAPATSGVGRIAAPAGAAPAGMPALLPPDPEDERRSTKNRDGEAGNKKQDEDKAGTDDGDPESGAGSGEEGANPPADESGEQEGDSEPSGGDDEPKSGEGDAGGDAPPTGDGDPPPASDETGGGKDG